MQPDLGHRVITVRKILWSCVSSAKAGKRFRFSVCQAVSMTSQDRYIQYKFLKVPSLEYTSQKGTETQLHSSPSH